MILPVDTAVAVPINLMPLVGLDGVTVDTGVVYNEAGLVLSWNFTTVAGVTTRTAVTPTNTGGDYDFVDNGGGMYEIEIPASGGASANNSAEGTGWFSGYATAVAPFRGPEIEFVAQQAIDSFTSSTNPVVTKLLKYLALLARKDSAIATDLATELGEINQNFSSGAGAFASTTDSLEGSRDEANTSLSGISSNVDAIGTVTTGLASLVVASGTIGDTGNTTSALHLEGLAFGDDELNGLLLVIRDSSASEYHARLIRDWADTGDLATLDSVLPFTPENDVDTYVVYALGSTNVQMVNRLLVDGAGTEGDPWGPAA